jgi:CheY-like chemotaxis protein
MFDSASETSGAPQEAETSRGHAGYRPKVLVVDDNDAAAQALADYLEAAGYRVFWADDGSEAIEAVASHRPDVILMDVMMPGLDGIEATRRIRGLPGLAGTPIIMVSALAMPDECGRGLAAGADEYLCKPISLGQLIEAIRRQLARMRSQDG